MNEFLHHKVKENDKKPKIKLKGSLYGQFSNDGVFIPTDRRGTRRIPTRSQFLVGDNNFFIEFPPLRQIRASTIDTNTVGVTRRIKKFTVIRAFLNEYIKNKFNKILNWLLK